jgi:hypothetical protein
MKHQHGRESAGMIFIARFMNSFLHQASFATGYWCYDRHRSVRLVVLVGLANDQIAQSGLSSLSVIYYSAQLFSVGLRVPPHPLYVVSAASEKTTTCIIAPQRRGDECGSENWGFTESGKRLLYNVRFWHTAAVKM